MKIDPSPELALLGRSYENAARAYTVAVSRAGGGSIYEEDDFTLTILPHAHGVSGVISPCFSDADVDDRILKILSLARPHHEDIRIKLGPSSQPADLNQRLKAHGLRSGASMKYYGMDVDRRLPEVRCPEGLRVYLIEDFDALLYQPHPFYGAKASPRKRTLLGAFARLVQETPRRLFAFAAEQNGHFAGMAVTFIHEDVVVGFDFVILQPLRRQGIGSFMMMYMGDFVRRQGVRHAALLSSTQGLHFYPHLGFQPLGIYPTFVYNRALQAKF
jgi:GNAT superfamily N-acetyltransferase